MVAHALIALLLVGGSMLSTRQAHHDALAAHHAERYLFGICAEWGLLLLVWWGLHVKRTSFTGMLGFRRGWQALAEDIGAAAAFGLPPRSSWWRSGCCCGHCISRHHRRQ